MNQRKLPHGYRIVRGKVTAAQTDALADVGAVASSPGNVLLAHGNTRRTVLLGGLHEVRKLYHHIGSREAWRALRGDTSVRREFDNSVRALELGLPVPRPLFAAERRSLGILTGQLIAFEYVENGYPLHAALTLRQCNAPPALSAKERLDLLRRYALLLATMHRASVQHRDMGSRNVLVVQSGGSMKLWLLDWLTAKFAHTIGEGADKSDLLQAAGSLLRIGVPLVEVHAFYTVYCDALGWQVTQRRRTARWLVQEVRKRQAHAITRTLRNAMRKGRRSMRRRLADGRVLCALRSDADRAVAALAPGRHADPAAPAHKATPQGIQVCDDANAVQTWQAACVCERFRLPCRRVLGVAVRGKCGSGQLAIEQAGGAPLEPELQEPATRAPALDDLRTLAVLLHSFGLRFHNCASGTICRAGQTNPIAAQRSRGLAVQDPTALRAQPESGTRASWDAVAAYVASQCGPHEGAAFAQRARPLADRPRPAPEPPGHP